MFFLKLEVMILIQIFLKLAKDVACSPKRAELVHFFMFWSPSRYEWGQGVLRELLKIQPLWQDLHPWESKSCKILHAFESSLRSS